MQIAAQKDFFDANSEWISALAIVVVTIIVAKVVDLLLSRSARRMRSAANEGEAISQEMLTRLRLVRRLIVLAVVLLGLFFALAQINTLRSLGTALLASSAVVGVAVGIAARTVLANALAGMMLASVQPFRIGDVVEWREQRGLVEDITLTYTFIRLPSGHRLVIPNDLIATTPVANYTIAGSVVDAEAIIEVAPQKATAALSVLREQLHDATVQFGRCQVDRYEIRVSFSTTAGHEATERFATREQVVAILSDAGILDDDPPPA